MRVCVVRAFGSELTPCSLGRAAQVKSFCELAEDVEQLLDLGIAAGGGHLNPDPTSLGERADKPRA